MFFLCVITPYLYHDVSVKTLLLLFSNLDVFLHTTLVLGNRLWFSLSISTVHLLFFAFLMNGLLPSQEKAYYFFAVNIIPCMFSTSNKMFPEPSTLLWSIFFTVFLLIFLLGSVSMKCLHPHSFLKTSHLFHSPPSSPSTAIHTPQTFPHNLSLSVTVVLTSSHHLLLDIEVSLYDTYSRKSF